VRGKPEPKALPLPPASATLFAWQGDASLTPNITPSSSPFLAIGAGDFWTIPTCGMTTAEKLSEHQGICSGFVVMPNHVHAVVWFAAVGALSPFMKSWKQTTSLRLKRVLRGVAPNYAATFPPEDPFWQAKYYPFNLYSDRKAREKLDYMHLNPVRAGLVAQAADWRWSSAAYYERGSDVGIPLRWIFEA
jgi:putative transposase